MFGSILEKKALRLPKNIVFSPHVDDEVIGCFLALEHGLITDVVYFYDLTLDRVNEATRSAHNYNFKPWFCRELWPGPENMVDIPLELLYDIDASDTIWCPTARDTHIQHALVNKAARRLKLKYGCKLVFYTVDMESFQQPLPAEFRDKKKAVLADLFPSQKALLTNEKYHLFEGYSEKDHTTVRSYTLGEVTVTMEGYNPPVDIDPPGDDELDDEYLNRLIVSYYDRVNVSMIAVLRGSTMVKFNG